MSEIQNAIGNAVQNFQKGNIEVAEKLLLQALCLDPNNLPANEILGIIKASRGEYSEAIKYLKAAIQCSPNNLSALYNLAKVLTESDNNLEAIYFHEKVVSADPNNLNAWINYGKSLAQLNRPKDALETFDKVLSRDPKNVFALLNKGATLKELDQYEEALILAETAISFEPNLVEAWLNKGIALKNLKRYGDAIKAYDAAISIKPKYAQAWSNKGVVFIELHQFHDAIKCFEKALDSDPNHFEAWCNKGAAYSELNQFNNALDDFDKAISINPNYAEAWTNKSFLLLQRGDLESGFKLYEWRLKSKEMALYLASKKIPGDLWTGEQPLMGKSILLFSEQGIGDTIHFCRYAKLVSHLGANVSIQVQKPLVTLLKSLEGVSEVISNDETYQKDYDFHCPLLSLPLIFKTNLQNIPTESSYIAVDSELLQKWANRLGPKSKPRIGLTWSSASGFKADYKRSMSFADFIGCLPENFDDFDFICLQKVIKDSDKPLFNQIKNVRFYGDELNDFSDTAAIITNLDLVVSTCTSIPHLSGALGVPTWLLLSFVPDWRWLLQGENTAWYPKTKLFRQVKNGDWADVTNHVKNELSSLNF